MTTSQTFEFPPKEGFIVTHFLTVADVGRSADFYQRVLARPCSAVANRPSFGSPIAGLS